MLVGNIGQLTPWKNQKEYIEVAERVCSVDKNAHFVVVGSPLNEEDHSYAESLQRLVEDKGLMSFVTFISYQEDIRTLISQLDLVLHMAKKEPFGRVIVEAMSLEKPVIGYNSGGPKEIIVNDETGYLIEDGDMDSFVRKTLDLLNQPELRMKLGSRARQRVIENFDAEMCAKSIEKTLMEI